MELECPNCGHRLSINRDYKRKGGMETYTASIWCSQCEFEEELVVVVTTDEVDAKTVYKQMFQQFMADASAGMYSNN
jgi:transcription elongation factor Elf1